MLFPKAERKPRAWNRWFIWELNPEAKSKGKARMNQRRRGKPFKGALLKWPPLWVAGGQSVWHLLKSSIAYLRD